MKPSIRISICCFVLLLLWALPANAQLAEIGKLSSPSDSADALVYKLCSDYNTKKITAPEFITRADSLMVNAANRQSQPVLLALYKDVAWSDEQFRKSRIRYFFYSAVNELNNRNLGSAVFFYRKTLDYCSSPADIRFFLRSYVGLLMINGEIGNAAKGLEEYRHVLPLVDYICQRPQSWKMEELAENAILLSYGAGAYAGTGNVTEAKKSFSRLAILRRYADSVLPFLHSQAEKKHAYFIGYKYFLTSYQFRSFYRDEKGALADIRNAWTYSNKQGEDESDASLYIYSTLAQFFLAQHNTDSAAYYIHLFELQSTKERYRLKKHSQEQSYYLASLYTELNQAKGNLPRALFYARRASDIQDSIYQAMTLDYYNNLYAQTQAAYDKDQRIKTEIAKSRTEHFNFLLELFIFIVILAAVMLFYWNRLKQRQAIVQSKLNLARNIHDEIAPMLLYAKMLMKAESRKNGNVPIVPELDQQIGKTLEAVRMLAHELKSEEQYTVSDLGRFLQEQLKKNEKINGTEFSLSVEDGTKILSLYQFDHLKKIYAELIANTIKHAESTAISITIKLAGQKLCLNYSDNGKGLENVDGKGIGLDNIQERTRQLKGTFLLENNYPNGYKVTVEIPV
ncbi:sensor histidine kinase [Taibaiella soli]|uniref:histidine kinase n=1 Tax=Taibaiella soli TaxID=1649169 RepID=A0A2W2AIC5_9BACT|nr:ATP-binding protein [Taibaiella soli]PZF73332.1 hypothetical protein DN068_09190 [Taibaiella soli]